MEFEIGKIIGEIVTEQLIKQILENKFLFNKKPDKRDPFLNYDSDWLLNWYSSEVPIAPGIPYSEQINFLKDPLPINIEVMQGDFKLQTGNPTWQSISNRGFEALLASKRIDKNEGAVRLNSIKRHGQQLKLYVQKAYYHDQAHSNLILDWDNEKDYPVVSLRSLLKNDFGTRFSKLEDKRLANTVGVACLLFFKEKDQLVPYLVRRVAKMGVFPGGLHCTSSGVANWPSVPERSYENFFLQAILSELKEEVGLTRSDIVDLKPVALCREYLRGGKPQFFFVGYTNLRRSDLRKKRKEAADFLKKTQGWPEIEKNKFLRSGETVIPLGKLISKYQLYGITLEGIGSLIYGEEYLNKYRSIFDR